ncbi:hypothetical protein Q4Q49_06535 [Shewanella sp. SP1S1-7]|uniref:hypothetical protein n=1 Tax=Shewanella sp. SP1S1-7 TaxID=3063536 RepID=UPI00289253AB|nr:hypothetical protein [Shewanella sp. SP1S1-7]MDT3334953.1 hypothetical protein [Shewanella sp. SP1S1-7]
MSRWVLLLFVVMFFSSSVYAGGFTSAATPIRVDIVQGQGVLVYGAFGNPAACTVTDKIFILKSHPQYEQIYAAILTAFASGKKVQAYIHGCKPVAWYTVETVTYSHIESYGSLNLMN